VGDRRRLEIDPRPRKVSGKNAAPVEFRKGTSANPASESWPTPAPTPLIDTLGSLRTDADGRLIVLGGRGVSGATGGAPITNYANNDNWFDDTSDGPVTAHLELNGRVVPVAPAWVLCGPPDFAPHVTNVVTLYDLLYDLAARELTLPANEAVYTTGALKSLGAISTEFRNAGKPELINYKPDFNEEIYPILRRAADVVFLFDPTKVRHDRLRDWAVLGNPGAASAAARNAVMVWIRPPDAVPGNSFPYMPKLLGDEPYALAAGVYHKRIRQTVTATQYALLQQWAKGKFIAGTGPAPPPAVAPPVTPEGLDRAALENCVGGSFFPGIETGWQIRHKALFQAPFRIKHGAAGQYRGDPAPVAAGHFTRQMAVPWQADFLQCKSENETSGPFAGLGLWGWWPAQRPDQVFTSEADFRAVPRRPVGWHRATAGGPPAPAPWPTGFDGDHSTPSYVEMLAHWRRFGFIVEATPGVFLETERDPRIP
jgi:hypothetical protein